MSVEHAPRRGRAIGRLGLAIVVLLLAAAVWQFAPWRRVPGLAVEGVRILPPSAAGSDSGERAAPRRIEIMFSTPQDVEGIRRRYGAGFITAKLQSCAEPDRSWREVIVQGSGILVDNGRVTGLPTAGGRSRYRAIFDDRLAQTVDHDAVFTPAIGTALCFTLEGGSMFMGRIVAATIPLPPLR